MVVSRHTREATARRMPSPTRPPIPAMMAPHACVYGPFRKIALQQWSVATTNIPLEPVYTTVNHEVSRLCAEDSAPSWTILETACRSVVYRSGVRVSRGNALAW